MQISHDAQFYFRRSKTLSNSKKRELGQHLWTHVQEAQSLITEFAPYHNLYISGSLGRGEPCIREQTTQRFLQSDIDWVLVGKTRPSNLNDIENALNLAFPEFSDTLYYIPIYTIDKLFSASAFDLKEGMAFPVYQYLDIPTPQAPKIGTSEMLEVIVYQLTGLVDQSSKSSLVNETSFLRTFGVYHLHKTTVDLMRAMSVYCGGQPTLNDADRLCEHGNMRMVFSKTEIRNTINERENWRDKTKLSKVCLIDRFFLMLKEIFESSSCSLPVLIKRCSEYLYPSQNMLHIFPRLVIIKAASLVCQTEELACLESMTADCLDAIKDLGFALQLRGNSFYLSDNPELKNCYLLEMITLKDKGGAIWKQLP